MGDAVFVGTNPQLLSSVLSQAPDVAPKLIFSHQVLTLAPVTYVYYSHIHFDRECNSFSLQFPGMFHQNVTVFW